MDLFCTLRWGRLNVFACCSFWEVMLKISLSMTVPPGGTWFYQSRVWEQLLGVDFHESSKVFFLPYRLFSLLLEFFCPFDLLFFFICICLIWLVIGNFFHIGIKGRPRWGWPGATLNHPFIKTNGFHSVVHRTLGKVDSFHNAVKGVCEIHTLFIVILTCPHLHQWHREAMVGEILME
jgi:hypothetical protein